MENGNEQIIDIVNEQLVAEANPTKTHQKSKVQSVKKEAEPVMNTIATTEVEENIETPSLLAEASQPEVLSKHETPIFSESDIPVTRPENLRYTKEELALMKKQAEEAYIKWIELELEISKYNIEQTAQK